MGEAWRSRFGNRLHGSVMVALPFFAWMAASRMRGPVMLAQVIGVPLATAWAWGGLLACGLLVALTLHEAAQMVAARLYGGRLRPAPMMLLGGCGDLEGIDGAGAQVAVALAGPVASLAGGLLCQVASLHVPASHVDLGCALALLGQAQAALGALDLLPAAPFDGGRALRALLQRRIGAARSLRVISHAGHALAALAALGGVIFGSVLPVALAAVLYAGAERAHGEALGQCPA